MLNNGKKEPKFNSNARPRYQQEPKSKPKPGKTSKRKERVCKYKSQAEQSKNHLKSSQTEGNTLRKGKSSSKNRNKRENKTTLEKNPMHCNAEGAGNQGRNHRKTTWKTNRGNQHQPMQQQQPLQQHENAKKYKVMAKHR